MKKNMGTTDKLIRVLLGTAIAVLYFFDVFSGTVGAILAIVAILFLMTSLLNYCPLYSIFGIRTCKTEDKDQV